MGKIIFKVKKEGKLLDFLVKEARVSKRGISRLKRTENGITRNGKLIRTVDKVYAGDVIELYYEDDGFLQPNGSLEADILYENDNLVVFDKPANMPVHPSVKHQGDTLGNLFSYKYPKITFRPVNRLDRDTSGLCLVAKNAFSAAALQGNVKKTYYAAVSGCMDGEGTIDLPIAREHDSIIKRIVRSDGQRAVTHYKTLCSVEKYSLLKIDLETGRTHQIRVHFSHIGHPLAGDDLYGGNTNDIKRQALHCGRLDFKDPLTGKSITIISPVREDIMLLFKKESKKMEKIASFQVDHRKINVGMYISRIDGDIVTYDVRMVKPNGGVYLENPAMHTIEHLFATFARNSEFGNNIVYVGPMGCRTGFYLLTKGLDHQSAIGLVRDAYKFIADYDGEIPGCSEEECGNYKEHSLEGAKKAVLPLLKALENYTVEMLEYSWHM